MKNSETRNELLSFFSGVWKIERTITHRFPVGESYQATGLATFSLEKNGDLLYQEEVEMCSLRTKDVFQGTQQYIYKYDSASDTLAKYFSDGRFFYKLEISGNTASGNHFCKEDNYKANYIFKAENIFSLTYLVKGPRKDYIMKTAYVR